MASLRIVATLTPPNTVGMAALAFTPDSSRLLYPHGYGEILYIWELSLIREQLATMNLAWDLPPYRPATFDTGSEPINIKVDLGSLAPNS